MKIFLRSILLTVLALNVCVFSCQGTFSRFLLDRETFECTTTDDRVAQVDVLCRALIKSTCREFVKNQLHLFDGSSDTQQCHLNSLKVVLLARDEAFKAQLASLTIENAEELAALAPEVQWNLRFLALNLFLTPEVTTNKCALLLELLKPDFNLPRWLKDSLRSGICELKQVAKQQLAAMRTQLFVDLGQRFCPLLLERLREEALQLPRLPDGRVVIPKVLGISVFLAAVKELNVWTVLVCKSTQVGEPVFIRGINPDMRWTSEIPENEPIVVIAGRSDDIATFVSAIAVLSSERLQHACAAGWMTCDEVQGPWAAKNTEQLERAFPECLTRIDGIGPQISEMDTIFEIEHMFPDVNTSARIAARTGI